ncbi:MAG: hypothetical protein AAF546_00085 [Verrucomicrobiota bacterium]
MKTLTTNRLIHTMTTPQLQARLRRLRAARHVAYRRGSQVSIGYLDTKIDEVVEVLSARLRTGEARELIGKGREI